jgi:hypothetical protein
MVEVEMRKFEAGTEKVASANVDVNELISKVRDFVDSIKEMSMGGQRVAVNVDGFNFSVGKADGKYDLSLNVNLSFVPKVPEEEDKPLSFEPF